MKKLIATIPILIATSFLALAFLLPATAAGVVRTVAPGVQLAVGTAGNVSTAAVKQQAGQTGVRSSTATNPSTSTSEQKLDRTHGVSTSGHSNCGRFGNGFHGGKHNFVCPNRRFPQPATS